MLWMNGRSRNSLMLMSVFVGSLLIGTTEPQLDQLKHIVQQFSAAGIRAEYLSKNDLAIREPELGTNEHSGAAFLPDDCQLDAHRTVAFIEKVFAGIFLDLDQDQLVGAASFNITNVNVALLVMICFQGNRHFISQGRYAEFYNDPAVCLIRSFHIANVPYSFQK